MSPIDTCVDIGADALATTSAPVPTGCARSKASGQYSSSPRRRAKA